MQGVQVSCTSSATDALKAAQETAEAYHLIISDIGMPGMDGYALLSELRKMNATATTPAIALSGFTRPADVDRALATGFETHVRKPANWEQLLALVSRLSR